MIVQRYPKGFRHRIQLEPVQVRQKNPGKSHRIHDGRIAFHILSHAVFLNKAHIKIRIVSHHHTAFTELHKFRQNLLDDRRINHHGIIDGGQLLNTEGNRNLRIHKGGKTVGNLSPLNLHSADFNDAVILRTKARGL